MSESVNRILANRGQFVGLLKRDAAQNAEIITRLNSEIGELEHVQGYVSELSKKVEHSSLIPLGRNIYIEGVIKHTGEYFLDQKAHPDSYSLYETADNTIKLLETRIEKQKELLKTAQENERQLEDKMGLLQGGDEIISNKGVAVKVGDFYEIIEYED